MAGPAVLTQAARVLVVVGQKSSARRTLHVLDRRHTLEHSQEHLDEKEGGEDGEHGYGEDRSGWKETVVAGTDRVEEKEEELLKEEGDDDAVDGAAVDVLVDLGALVSEVDVVPVHPVLHDHVEQPEGRYQRADD